MRASFLRGDIDFADLFDEPIGQGLTRGFLVKTAPGNRAGQRMAQQVRQQSAVERCQHGGGYGGHDRRCRVDHTGRCQLGEAIERADQPEHRGQLARPIEHLRRADPARFIQRALRPPGRAQRLQRAIPQIGFEHQAQAAIGRQGGVGAVGAFALDRLERQRQGLAIGFRVEAAPRHQPARFAQACAKFAPAAARRAGQHRARHDNRQSAGIEQRYQCVRHSDPYRVARFHTGRTGHSGGV